MRIPVAVVFFLFSSVLPLHAAPATTGNLEGLLLDSSGAALPGVRLVLSGPHLQGSRSTLSSKQGHYRFLHLPPGDAYRVEASLDGFQRRVIAQINVSLGKSATLHLMLQPAIFEEVTVEAAPLLVDLRNTSSSTTITAAQFDTLPIRRDFQQLTILAPGVRFDRDTVNPTVGGATFLENDYIIEGMSTRDPGSGSSATNLTMNFVQEVQVMTGAFSAEYGRALGGVINVVSKTGGNSVQGDVFAFFEDADWSSENVSRSQRGSDTYDLGHDKYDVGFSLGAPIVRDRLWFFGAYAPRRDHAIQDLVNARFGVRRREPLDEKEHVFAGKLTALILEGHSLTVSAFGNPSVQRGWFGLPQADSSAALAETFRGSQNALARYDAIIGNNLSLETILGRHETRAYVRALTEIGRTVPNQSECAPGRGCPAVHGGRGGSGRIDSIRDFAAARSSLYLSAHHVRYGAEFERNRVDRSDRSHSFIFRGQQMVNAAIGRRDVLIEESVDFSGYGRNDTTSIFLQDSWQISPRLLANIGLRWEQQVVSSARGVTIATGVGPDGRPIAAAANDFTFDDNWAPRLGFAWDPTGEGRAKVYATGGRYFQSLPVAIYVASMSGFNATINSYYSLREHTSENWWNPTGSPLNEDWIRYDTFSLRSPAEPSPIAAGTRLQYQDELSLGFERAIGSVWAVGARVVNRELERAVEDMNTYDPGNPRVRTGYLIGNPGETELAPGLPKPSRKYQALELSLHRRLSDNWQMFASFVSSRSRGNFDGFYEYSTYVPLAQGTYAFDNPRWMENSDGKLRADIPYQFKIHSSYSFPFGLTLSEAFVYSAGYPLSAIVATFPRRIYLTPRGTEGRGPDHWTLDLHGAWRLPRMGLPVDTSVIVDVFNATNNHQALDLEEEYVYQGMPGWQAWYDSGNLDEFNLPRYRADLPVSPFYGSPLIYQQPRSFQLGIKLSF